MKAALDADPALLRGDPRHRSLRHIVREAGWAGFAQIAGRGASYVLLLAIGRTLGTVGVGTYALAAAVGHGVARGGTLGLDLAILRYTAHHRARGQPAETVGMAVYASAAAALASIVIGLALVVAADPLARAFDREQFANILKIAAVLAPLIALGQVWRSGLRGFFRVRTAVVLDRIAIPLLALGLLLGLLAYGDNRADAGAIAWLVATALIALVSLGMFIRHLLREMVRPTFEPRVWTRFAVPIWLEGVLNFAFVYGGRFVVGAFVGVSAVGVYSAAVGVAALVTLPLEAVNMIFAPAAASLVSVGDGASLRRLYTRLALMTALPSVTLGVLLVILRDPTLRLFGEDFVVGATPLMILIGGQVANVMTGSSGMLIAMMGYPTLRLVNAAAAVAVGISTQIALTPVWGVSGAAVGLAASIAVVGVLQMIQVRVLLGVWPYSRRSAWTA